MKNLSKLVPAAILVSAVVFYSCKKEDSVSGKVDDNPNSSHSVKIFLTDHATPVFDSVFIDIRQLEVKVEDDGNVSNGGWVNVSIHPGVYNILRLRNGIDTLFANGTLPSARIRKLRLTLGTMNSAMKNGQSFPLKLDNNDKQVEAELNDSNFEITAPGQIAFWIDFDAGSSIQVDNSGSGNNNGYRLKAHISIFSKHKSASLEGIVLPKAADAIVKAVLGTDTTMAIPDDDDGEFKIMGLKTGVYKILYDGQNGYKDTTLLNIQVSGSEEKHLPTITLHQ